MPPSAVDRQALAMVAHQLATCAEVTRALALNAVRDRAFPNSLACDLGTLQLLLQLQLTEARRILSQWPEPSSIGSESVESELVVPQRHTHTVREGNPRCEGKG